MSVAYADVFRGTGRAVLGNSPQMPDIAEVYAANGLPALIEGGYNDPGSTEYDAARCIRELMMARATRSPVSGGGGVKEGHGSPVKRVSSFAYGDDEAAARVPEPAEPMSAGMIAAYQERAKAMAREDDLSRERVQSMGDQPLDSDLDFDVPEADEHADLDGFSVTRDGEYTMSKCLAVEEELMERVVCRAGKVSDMPDVVQQRFRSAFRVYAALHGSRSASDGCGSFEGTGEFVFTAVDGEVVKILGVTVRMFTRAFYPKRYLVTMSTILVALIRRIVTLRPDSTVAKQFVARAREFGLEGFEHVCFAGSLAASGLSVRDVDAAIKYKKCTLAMRYTEVPRDAPAMKPYKKKRDMSGLFRAHSGRPRRLDENWRAIDVKLPVTTSPVSDTVRFTVGRPDDVDEVVDREEVKVGSATTSYEVEVKHDGAVHSVVITPAVGQSSLIVSTQSTAVAGQHVFVVSSVLGKIVKSETGRVVSVRGGAFHIDVTTQPGMSGSPVFSKAGLVIGSVIGASARCEGTVCLAVSGVEALGVAKGVHQNAM